VVLLLDLGPATCAGRFYGLGIARGDAEPAMKDMKVGDNEADADAVGREVRTTSHDDLL
jgi:hypothetical protein